MSKDLKDPIMAKKIVSSIRGFGRKITLMHVCGTHQDTLVRYGLEPMLAEAGVTIRQGPGCPVCVTTPKEIEVAIRMARSGAIVTSFGDMLRVPGKERTLAQVRAEDSRSVLLGTRSFWEGVDVPGQALQAVIIVKLPFDVPSDPIFASRSETFDNPFFVSPA